MALCPQCKMKVARGELFCSHDCKRRYKSLALPLAYRPKRIKRGDAAAILRAVLKNAYHSPAISYKMRRGSHADPTGIICELSGLGQWRYSYGGVWEYVTPAGADDMTLPQDVKEWSGLTGADIELLQHAYDRREGVTDGASRISFVKAAIRDIIASHAVDKVV